MKTLNKWLLQSAENNNSSWAWYLTKAWKVDINYRNQQEKTSLHLAVNNKNKKIVESLLSYPDIIDVNARDIEGSTPLHVLASGRDNKEIAKLLLKNLEIDIDALDKQNKTPLHIAAEFGNVALAKLLIDKGASINLIDKDGNAPLHIALNSNKDKITKLLLKQPDIDVNLRDLQADTPLHIAVRKNYLAVDWLLQKGANVNLCNQDGDAPLHIAAAGGYREVIKCLLAKGAEVDVNNEKGKTPIVSALDNGQGEVAKLLLEAPKINPLVFQQYAKNQYVEGLLSPRVIPNHYQQGYLYSAPLAKPLPKKMIKSPSSEEIHNIYKGGIISKKALPPQLYPEIDSMEVFPLKTLKNVGTQDDFGIKLLGSSEDVQ